jgi:hypothetical protein
MNKTQKAVVGTAGLAVLAETFIGGIGVTMLGGAIGIPAAGIVAVAGGIALLCMDDDDEEADDESDTSDSPQAPSELTTYLLVKSGITHKISVNQNRGWGQTCLQTVSSPDWTNYRYFSTLGELRDFYKSLLQKGYKPA